MKRLKTLFVAAAAAFSCIACAQQWSLNALWDIETNSLRPVVSYDLGTIRNAFLVGDLDVKSYAGFDGQAGIALGKRFRLADEVRAFFGISMQAEPGRPLIGRPLIGISFSGF